MRRLEPFFQWLARPPRVTWLSYLPPFWPLEKARPPGSVWKDPNFAVPEELRTQPGHGRDHAKEDKVFEEEGPPIQWLHEYGAANEVILPNIWRSLLPTTPRFVRGYRRLIKAQKRPASPVKSEMSPQELTEAVKIFVRGMGISAVGVTDMDRRYLDKESQDRTDIYSKVIVCIMERNWEAIQTCPSPDFEQASLHTTGVLMGKMVKIAGFLHDKGYRATPLPFDCVTINIPMAVEAGLGQLGINGQLLTPQSGSRSSIVIITTEAPLVNDAPRDFGIEKLCDNCLVCVRRCPVSAIPAKRTEHRGVVKAKLRMERCLPLVAKAEGCGICMKVCPAQRYGIEAMIEHWEKTGTILGKGTDELEAYTFIDGETYGVGKRPPEPSPEFMSMPGVTIPPRRVTAADKAQAAMVDDPVIEPAARG